MKRNEGFVAALLLLLFFSAPAQAYIGPGMGAGTIAVVLGVIGSIFLALFSIIYYPIKRLLKKRKKQSEVAEANTETG